MHAPCRLGRRAVRGCMCAWMDAGMCACMHLVGWDDEQLGVGLRLDDRTAHASAAAHLQQPFLVKQGAWPQAVACASGVRVRARARVRVRAGGKGMGVRVKLGPKRSPIRPSVPLGSLSCRRMHAGMHACMCMCMWRSPVSPSVPLGSLSSRRTNVPSRTTANVPTATLEMA